jgi:uncharacterized protein YqgV (UPF0045/DUF77 family)
MPDMSAQISVYPLRRRNLAATIEAVLAALGTGDVSMQPGAMSTVIAGSEEAVFAVLREAYRAATRDGAAVMVATLSNACPVSAPAVGIDAPGITEPPGP